LGNVVFWKYI